MHYVIGHVTIIMTMGLVSNRLVSILRHLIACAARDFRKCKRQGKSVMKLRLLHLALTFLLLCLLALGV